MTGRPLFLVWGIFFSASFLNNSAAADDPIVCARILIGTTNVENAFDWRDTGGKRDEEFTEGGRKKWDKEKALLKVRRIGDVMKSLHQEATYDGAIFGAEELEYANAWVAKEIAQAADLPFYRITDSPDGRGINTAAFWRIFEGMRYKRSSFRFHRMDHPYFVRRKTRDILEVEFIFDRFVVRGNEGEVVKSGEHRLKFFVVHFPSQRNPDPEARNIPQRKLREIIEENLSEDPNLHYIVTGDFNTKTMQELDILLKQRDILFDVDTEYTRLAGWKKRAEMPPSSYWWGRDREWNKFDLLLVSPNLLDGTGLNVNLPSFKIHDRADLSRPWRTRPWGKGEEAGFDIPRRYDFRTKICDRLGYSDHWPVSFVLELLTSPEQSP